MKNHNTPPIIIFYIAVALFCSIATQSFALEIKPSGTLQVFTQWSTGSQLGFTSPYSKQEYNNNFRGAQFFQIQFDINPHDPISGSVLFEIDSYWGVDDGSPNGYGEFTGGQVGTDGVNIQTSHMFLHWEPMHLNFMGRAGIISVHLPNQIGGSLILDDSVAAIAMGYEFVDGVSSTLIWGRPYDRNSNAVSHETMDVFAATFTYAPDDHIISPYVAFTNFGRNVAGDPLGSAWVDGGNIGLWNGFQNFSGNPWAVWTGFSGRYHSKNDIIAKTDLMWGTLDGGSDAASRQGAIFLAEIDWVLDNLTIGILGWWATGDDDNAYKNGAGRMPFITNQWGLTDFGYYKSGLTTETNLILQDATGRWTVGFLVDDLNWVDHFSTSLKFLYMRGTNSTDAVKNNRFSKELLKGGYRNNWGTYLTNKDWLIELDSESTLKLSEQLSLIIRLGYIHIEVDPNVWGTSDTRDAYRAVLLWDYEF